MKSRLLSLVFLFFGATSMAQVTPIAQQLHVTDEAFLLIGAMSKIGPGQNQPLPPPNENSGFKVVYEFSSSDRAFVVNCAEIYQSGIKADEYCDVTIDSTKSISNITKAYVASYTPIVVVDFLSTNDVSFVNQMTGGIVLASMNTVQLKAADGKNLSVPKWQLIPESGNSEHRASFYLVP